MTPMNRPRDVEVAVDNLVTISFALRDQFEVPRGEAQTSHLAGLPARRVPSCDQYMRPELSTIRRCSHCSMWRSCAARTWRPARSPGYHSVPGHEAPG